MGRGMTGVHFLDIQIGIPVSIGILHKGKDTTNELPNLQSTNGTV